MVADSPTERYVPPDPATQPRTKAWVYTGKRFYMEGVPFGDWVNPGDVYTSVTPITPADFDLLGVIRTTLVADDLFAEHTKQCQDSPCAVCMRFGQAQSRSFDLLRDVLDARGEER
jgi:hypothetical protein